MVQIHLVLCKESALKNAWDFKGEHSYFNQEAGVESQLQEFFLPLPGLFHNTLEFFLSESKIHKTFGKYVFKQNPSARMGTMKKNYITFFKQQNLSKQKPHNTQLFSEKGGRSIQWRSVSFLSTWPGQLHSYGDWKATPPPQYESSPP